LPEVVCDAGLLIDVSKEFALCDALEYLYDNPKKRKEFRKKGIERAKKFTWNASAEIIHRRILQDIQLRETK
jgi:glycosyltransferase involved in cell wall biosynthesis